MVIFYSKLDELERTTHSIFCDARIKDFETLFVKDIPVIFAWEVNKKLEPLAIQAVKRINEKTPYGLLKEGTKLAYYHPLPKKHDEQEQWCQAVCTMLKKI